MSASRPSALTSAHELSQHAVGSLDEVCALEQRRIQQSNEAAVRVLTLQVASLWTEWQALQSRLNLLAPTPRSAVLRRWYYGAVFALFTAGGLISSHFTLGAFAIGWEVWVFCGGLALVGAFSTEEFLQRYHATRAINVVIITAFICGLAGLLLLSHLRGDILLLLLRNAIGGASENADRAGMIADGASFYLRAAPKLQWFFAFLSIAAELSAGLALFHLRNTEVGSDAEIRQVKERKRHIELELADLVGRRTTLENEPKIFEAEFQRNLRLGLFREKSASDRLFRFLGIFLVGIVFVSATRAQPLHVIVGMDLSKSESNKSAPGDEPHQKDVQAVAQLISRLPAGARFEILGITDQSFSKAPQIVAGQIPVDPGSLAFINQIDVAKKRFADRFRRAAHALPPTFDKTDLLGFFVLASRTLAERDGHRVIIVVSDMRQCTRELDIESVAVVPVSAALQTVRRKGLLANLRGIDTFILGFHSERKDVRYASSLEQFWRAYFTAAGANLRVFSMNRDIPDLNRDR